MVGKTGRLLLVLAAAASPAIGQEFEAVAEPMPIAATVAPQLNGPTQAAWVTSMDAAERGAMVTPVGGWYPGQPNIPGMPAPGLLQPDVGGGMAPMGGGGSVPPYFYKQQGPYWPNIAPKDPYGPSRMQLPTPVRGHDFGGVSDFATSMRDDTKTIGIRLDNMYGAFRSIEVGNYFSEYQNVTAAGATILPFQAPCWLVGMRMMGGRVDNLSVRDDVNLLSLDLFAATRYKSVYTKFGALWDHHQNHGKTGLQYGVLTPMPHGGNMTFETALAWGYGSTVIGPERGDFFRLKRTEVADIDIQFRLGTFITRSTQVGLVYQYYDWQLASHESNAGAFINWNRGRNRIGFELTGGDEGARGFVTFVRSFGPTPNDHPTDCNIQCVDVLGWITRPVDRDLSVRSRSTFRIAP